MPDTPDRNFGFNTRALHHGYQPDPTTGARAVPIYQTTSFVFKDSAHATNLFALQEFGNIYTRIMNPTTDVLEQRVASLENGVAGLAMSSGQSAQFITINSLMEAGDEMVAATTLYGGTYTQFDVSFRKMGYNVKFVDPDDPENFRKAITPKTKAIVAVGNSVLTIVYHLLSDPDARFCDLGPAHYESQINKHRRARDLATQLQALTGQRIVIPDGKAIITDNAA